MNAYILEGRNEILISSVCISCNVIVNGSFLVTVNCGGYISDNCTYFENPGSSYNEAGTCYADVGRINDNICQLRLDFDEFEIRQPYSSSLGSDYQDGTCAYDTFSVTNSQQTFPVICGYNTGSHSKSTKHTS